MNQQAAGFSFRYRKIAEALYFALTDDAFYISLEMSVDPFNNSRESMFRYMDYSMTEAERYGELVIPEDRMFGASIWSKPIGEALEDKKKQQKERFIREQMGEKSLATYTTIVDFMSAQSAPIVSAASWYLSIVGLLPDFQGQGRGFGLIESVLKKTDSRGVSTYLETFTPRNMSFYERFGFTSVAFFDEPTTRARYWLMIREPR